MSQEIINTAKAPAAIGTYSQAVKVGNTVYMSGQIALVPATMEMAGGTIEDQVVQVFKNLRAVAQAAGGDLVNIVKLNIFLDDLSHFAIVNEIMGGYFSEPFPARAVVEVSALPREALVEMDAIMVLG